MLYIRLAPLTLLRSERVRFQAQNVCDLRGFDVKITSLKASADPLSSELACYALPASALLSSSSAAWILSSHTMEIHLKLQTSSLRPHHPVEAGQRH